MLLNPNKVFVLLIYTYMYMYVPSLITRNGIAPNCLKLRSLNG